MLGQTYGVYMLETLQAIQPLYETPDSSRS